MVAVFQSQIRYVRPAVRKPVFNQAMVHLSTSHRQIIDATCFNPLLLNFDFC